TTVARGDPLGSCAAGRRTCLRKCENGWRPALRRPVNHLGHGGFCAQRGRGCRRFERCAFEDRWRHRVLCDLAINGCCAGGSKREEIDTNGRFEVGARVVIHLVADVVAVTVDEQRKRGVLGYVKGDRLLVDAGGKQYDL